MNNSNHREELEGIFVGTEFARPPERGLDNTAWLPEFMKRASLEGLMPDEYIHLSVDGSWLVYDKLTGSVWMKAIKQFDEKAHDFSNLSPEDAVVMRVYDPSQELDGYIIDARTLEPGDIISEWLSPEEDDDDLRFAEYRNRNKMLPVAAMLFADPDRNSYPVGDINYYPWLIELADRRDKQFSE